MNEEIARLIDGKSPIEIARLTKEMIQITHETCLLKSSLGIIYPECESVVRELEPDRIVTAYKQSLISEAINAQFSAGLNYGA